LIAQSIGQAFHVAYSEFLKANGIESPSHQLGDVDYQDVLNQQEVFGEELSLFTNKEMQKEVRKIIPLQVHNKFQVTFILVFITA
jgi:amyloid beta A4 precursor protein-binding family A member 2